MKGTLVVSLLKEKNQWLFLYDGQRQDDQYVRGIYLNYIERTHVKRPTLPCQRDDQMKVSENEGNVLFQRNKTRQNQNATKREKRCEQ